MSGWNERMRGLGRSVVELLRAEVAALSDDLASSRRVAGEGLVALVIGLAVAFWAVGAAVAFVALVLAIWLPAWAAVGLVLLLLVGVAVLALRRARERFAAVENPLGTVRRHVDEHLSWWQGQLQDLRETAAVGATIDEASSSPTGSDRLGQGAEQREETSS